MSQRLVCGLAHAVGSQGRRGSWRKAEGEQALAPLSRARLERDVLCPCPGPACAARPAPFAAPPVIRARFEFGFDDGAVAGHLQAPGRQLAMRESEPGTCALLLQISKRGPLCAAPVASACPPLAQLSAGRLDKRLEQAGSRTISSIVLSRRGRRRHTRARCIRARAATTTSPLLYAAAAPAACAACAANSVAATRQALLIRVTLQSSRTSCSTPPLLILINQSSTTGRAAARSSSATLAAARST